jgi:small subunit ribosomal protein S1
MDLSTYTDLSWGRVTHPKKSLPRLLKSKLLFIDFDDDKKRIALGPKTTYFLIHGIHSAKDFRLVTKLLVKLLFLPTMEHLLKSQQVSKVLYTFLKCHGHSTLRSAQEFMKVGDDVEAVILTLDREERKCLSVSNNFIQSMGKKSKRDTQSFKTQIKSSQFYQLWCICRA